MAKSTTFTLSLVILSLFVLSGCSSILKRGAMYSMPYIEQNPTELGPEMWDRSYANMSTREKADPDIYSKDIRDDVDNHKRYYKNYWCSLEFSRMNPQFDVDRARYRKDALDSLAYHCKNNNGTIQASHNSNGYWCNVDDNPAFYFNVDAPNSDEAPVCIRSAATPMYLEIAEPIGSVENKQWYTNAFTNGFQTKSQYDTALKAEEQAKEAIAQIAEQKKAAQREKVLRSVREQDGARYCKRDSNSHAYVWLAKPLSFVVEDGSLVAFQVIARFIPTSDGVTTNVGGTYSTMVDSPEGWLACEAFL